MWWRRLQTDNKPSQSTTHRHGKHEHTCIGIGIEKQRRFESGAVVCPGLLHPESFRQVSTLQVIWTKTIQANYQQISTRFSSQMPNDFEQLTTSIEECKKPKPNINIKIRLCQATYLPTWNFWNRSDSAAYPESSYWSPWALHWALSAPPRCHTRCRRWSRWPSGTGCVSPFCAWRSLWRCSRRPPWWTRTKKNAKKVTNTFEENKAIGNWLSTKSARKTDSLNMCKSNSTQKRIIIINAHFTLILYFSGMGV